MSRIRTAAIGAAVVLGLVGTAGAQQTQARPDSAKWGARHGQMGLGGRHGGRGFGRGQGRGEGKFIKDLNLTDAQKNQIKAIHTKYEPQFKALRDQGKTQFGSMRDMRQKGDTSAAARARFQQQREQFRQRSMTIRQAEQKDIRAILTADQRTKWDAAQAQRKQRMEARQKQMKERGDKRGFRGKA